MKKIIVITLSILATTAYGKGVAEMKDKAKEALNMKSKTADAVLINNKDMKWMAAEGFQGVNTATVQGDAAKGAHHSFMKFDSGFSAPLHNHTSDHYVAVIAGTLILNVDGVEHRLPAGSYFSFKNKKNHITSCAPGAECLLFADVRGKWDVVPQKESTISSH